MVLSSLLVMGHQKSVLLIIKAHHIIIIHIIKVQMSLILLDIHSVSLLGHIIKSHVGSHVIMIDLRKCFK